MVTVVEVLRALEGIAPSRFAFSFDNVGLQLGDPSSRVTKAVVSLDRSVGALEAARSRGAELVVSHHPLFFSGVKTISPETYDGRCAFIAAKNGISIVTAHTNWDCAKHGVNDALADALQLEDVHSFGSGNENGQFRLLCFATPRRLDAVLDAIVGALSDCGIGGDTATYYSVGTGTRQFVAKVGSANGIQERERMETYRIEAPVPQAAIAILTAALGDVFFEGQIDFEFIALKPRVEQPIGRIGNLHSPMSLSAFNQLVSKQLGFPAATWGAADKSISRVAVVGGSACEEWLNAKREGADVLVTGEVKQHIALECNESDFAITQAGHFATEQPGVVSLANQLRAIVPSVDWSIFTPSPGMAGRPITEREEW